MEDAVGEDMAAVGVGRELDFIDGEELDDAVGRHRFDGADPIARTRRDDALLAGDERRLRGPPRPDDAVVDLAREQAQGTTDHAAAMAEHALDREVRLAGVGRAEDGGHPPRSGPARRAPGLHRRAPSRGARAKASGRGYRRGMEKR